MTTELEKARAIMDGIIDIMIQNSENPDAFADFVVRQIFMMAIVGLTTGQTHSLIVKPKIGPRPNGPGFVLLGFDIKNDVDVKAIHSLPASKIWEAIGPSVVSAFVSQAEKAAARGPEGLLQAVLGDLETIIGGCDDEDCPNCKPKTH